MNYWDRRHLRAFRTTHLSAGEQIELHVGGWVRRRHRGGRSRRLAGRLILTDRRACFFRKGLFVEVLESIPLAAITSVERRAVWNCRLVRLVTPFGELAFKTWGGRDTFDRLSDRFDELSASRAASPPDPDARPQHVAAKMPHSCAPALFNSPPSA